MANLRALVKRRKAVRNIRKITKTMELIATARFKRALDRATEAEAYTRKIGELAADLTPVVETLLPLSSMAVETRKPSAAAAGPAHRIDYEFLPDAADILEELVPAAFKARLFKCFLDAAVSEQIARRVAMKSATENAGDLIKEITRVYNRTRQANITKEISELIGGSEALK